LFVKERLPGKTTGQRRGAHYRDGNDLVNTFLKYIDNNFVLAAEAGFLYNATLIKS